MIIPLIPETRWTKATHLILCRWGVGIQFLDEVTPHYRKITMHWWFRVPEPKP